MKHYIKIDFQDANESIENICILGNLCKSKKSKKYANKLNIYLQRIWEESLKKQYKVNKTL